VEWPELFSRFAMALGIGLLIGLERGWRQRTEAAGSRTAGVRTFALAGLLGGTSGALAQALGGAANAGGGLMLGFAFAAFAIVFALFCREENRAEKSFSATTAVAGAATFALGAYALIGDLRIAAAAAVAMALVLASRESIHDAVKAITWPEMRAGLILLAMSAIALPLLPNQSIGPFGGINLRDLWLIAIMLAAISFVGYAAVKYLGATRGALWSGAAGGLVSSTAVTVANARRAATGAPPALMAAGAATASAVGLLRVLAVAGALNASLLPLLGPPLGAATLAMAACGLLMVRRLDAQQREHAVTELRNPFELFSVLGFALFLGFIVVAGRLLSQHYGAAGAIAGALASGIADVDAVTVSVSKLAPQPLSVQQAALAILAAVASNTLSKLAMGMAIGRGAFAGWMLATTVAAALAAGIAAWATVGLSGG
jgi:uncharacterized membrane protein (DUF4010 family)